MVTHRVIACALVVVNLAVANSLVSQRSSNPAMNINMKKYQSRYSQICRDSTARQQAAGDSPVSTVTMKEEEVRAAMKEGREVADPLSLLAAKKNEMVTAQLFDAASLDATFLQSLTAKRSYYSIVAERLMQTLDDYQLSAAIKKSNEIAMASISYTDDKSSKVNVKEKLVVLGTGWGSHAFLKTIDATKYDVQVISPRNYFMFTPMLAASAVGTVEFRSICEPIRNVNPFVDYLEATASTVDSVRKGKSRTYLSPYPIN